MVLVAFFRSSVINAIRDNLPPDIPIGDFPLVEGSACSQCEQDGTDDIELVVDIPRVVQTLGGESALKTRVSHTESHSIHMDITRIGLSQAQFGSGGVLILEDGDVYLDSLSSSHADVAGEGAEAGVVGNVVIIDVLALRDGVVEREVGVSDSNEGYDGDGEGDSGLGGQGFVLFPDGIDDFVEIAVGVVGLIGDHFEHP